MVVGATLVALAAFAVVGACQAQQPTPAPGGAAETVVSLHVPDAGDPGCGKPGADRAAKAAVSRIVSINGAAVAAGARPVVKLGDMIRLRVEELDALQFWGRCVGRDAGRVIVFVDGRPLPEGVAYPPLEPGRGEISFVLERTSASRKLWTELLGEPMPRGAGDAPVDVSIGLERLYPIPTSASVVINPLPGERLTIWVVLLALILFMLLFRVGPGEALRDDGIAPLRGKRPYSLARVGATGWFVALLTSYLFISVVTLDFLSSFTGVPAAIAAIAAGTVGFSSVIDASKDREAGTQGLRSFVAQCDALLLALRNGTIPLPEAPPPPADGWTGRIGELQTRYATFVAGTTSPTAYPAAIPMAEDLRDAPLRSRGFLTDVISDADGVAFHRYQFFAWTVVLLAVFLYLVWKDLAMPEFNAALLSLMGVSSGTYLGMKIPEPTFSGAK